VLFDYQGPTLTVELVPLSCPVRRSNRTSRNQIVFEECSPAQLVISTTPCEPFSCSRCALISSAALLALSLNLVDRFGC